MTSIQNNKSIDFEFHLFQQLKDELGEVVAELEALDGQEECKQNSKAKQMSIGRKKFNMDPKKGEFTTHFFFATEFHTSHI